MKVKHLIRELQKCDSELEVYTEGCDCHGDTYAVSLIGEGADVLIQRSSGSDSYDNGDDTPEPYEGKADKGSIAMSETLMERLQKAQARIDTLEAAWPTGECPMPAELIDSDE